MLSGGAKNVNFLEIGNFEHPSLTHQTSQRHQIFRFTSQIGILLDSHVLARSLCNWGRYCMPNYENSQNLQMGCAIFLILSLNNM